MRSRRARAAAAAQPKRDVRAALAGERPWVALITGVGSVAADDVRAQLRESEADLDLRVVRVSMHDPRAVARALCEASEAQAVVLTRGGGQTVHDLDDDELIGAVASSPVPVLVALGHASDDLVLGRVADACFPTPTALGAWLREAGEGKRAHARAVEEARLLSESRELLGQLGQSQARSRSRAEGDKRTGEHRNAGASCGAVLAAVWTPGDADVQAAPYPPERGEFLRSFLVSAWQAFRRRRHVTASNYSRTAAICGSPCPEGPVLTRAAADYGKRSVRPLGAMRKRSTSEPTPRQKVQ
jgi:hypothetical protein